MERFFKYANDSYQSLLKQNNRHNFAMRHALRIYSANAIYSFIPKNACSSLRVSLAMANGCIREPEQFNWVHHNNETFSADLASARTADYTFVILRCPFTRLASTYLDKIVGHFPDAWHLYDLTQRKCKVSAMSFDFFIRQLALKPIREGNIHWRPQVDFLLYEKYDDYFCLENFADVQEILQNKINLPKVDARPLTKHGLDEFALLGKAGEYATASAFAIMSMKQVGQCPSPLALYTDELVAIVNQAYRQDIDFYKAQFGDKNLMFS